MNPLQLTTNAAGALQFARPGGLAIVTAKNLGDRQPAAVLGVSIAWLINPAARTLNVPPLFGPCWLVVPADCLRTLFLGTNVQPPTENLQLSLELGLDAGGGWGSALLASGLFQPFTPTVFPLPVLAC